MLDHESLRVAHETLDLPVYDRQIESLTIRSFIGYDRKGKNVSLQVRAEET